MKVITRQLELEREVNALRAILNEKGAVSDLEERFRHAGAAGTLAGKSESELVEDMLQEYQGTKQ